MTHYEIQEVAESFRITDTSTDSRVATCYTKENAELVCISLNRSAECQERERGLVDKANGYVIENARLTEQLAECQAELTKAKENDVCAYFHRRHQQEQYKDD